MSAGSTFESTELALVKPRLRVAIPMLALALLGFVPMFVGLMPGREWVLALTFALELCLFTALVLVHRAGAWTAPIAGRLVVDDEAIRFDGKLLAKRRAISGGSLAARPDGSVSVQLTQWSLRMPMQELRASREGEARRLLAVLGLDVAQVVGAFHLPSRGLWTPTGQIPLAVTCLAAVPVLISVATTFGSAGEIAALAAFLGLFYLALRPTRLDVGTDGLTVTWYRYEKTIPYSDLLALERSGPDLALSLRSGERFVLPMQRAGVGPDAFAQRDAIERRIRDAITLHTRDAGTPETSALRRGDRPAGEWVRALRGIGAGVGADHRNAVPGAPHLWRLVESPREDPAIRAAAAVALGDGLDDAARARLRIAVDTTAEPRTRAALDAALRHVGEEEMAAALDALEPARGVGERR